MTLARLLRNGLTFSKLISHFESSRGVFEFYDKLKDIGIERKAAKSIADFLVRDHKPTGVVEVENRTEVGHQSSQNSEDGAYGEEGPKTEVQSGSMVSKGCTESNIYGGLEIFHIPC